MNRQGYVPQDLTIELTNDSARHVALERACRTVEVPKTECRDVTRYRDEIRERPMRLSQTGESFWEPSRRAGCREAREDAEFEARSHSPTDVSFSSCTCSREEHCTTEIFNRFTGQVVGCFEYEERYECEVTMTFLSEWQTESHTESVSYTDQVCEEITVDEQQCEPV